MKNRDYIRLYIAEDEEGLLELLLSIFLAGYRCGYARELEEEMIDPADLIRLFDKWLEADQL